MEKEYNFKHIEKKWQDTWETNKQFASEDFNDEKPKWYSLVEFPYPSGAGLHVGHPRSYTAQDIFCHYKRMKGYNVMFPMGWDAFGSPAENYAIKTGTQPSITVQNNVEVFKKQMKSLGYGFDWDREINTTDPNYYKWTQWIFLQFFKNGLAYEKESPINWCPSCKTGLSNEEVVNGHCERCDAEVTKKNLKQWYLRMTDYAEKLLDGLQDVDYSNDVMAKQTNWIGKSEGTEFNMEIMYGGNNKMLNVDLPKEKRQAEEDEPVRLNFYTTRVDTIYGMTYVVLAPEHPLVRELTINGQEQVVENYLKEVASKSEIDREAAKEKTGVFTGSYVVNPFTDKLVPIWVADYVLMGYGTGAVMAVPAHDERDFEFANKHELEIIKVIDGLDNEDDGLDIFTGKGILINSGDFEGFTSEQAQEKMTTWLEERGIGYKKVNYRLRDWVFSRQRYWGEPIPIVKCYQCGNVPVPEEQLPLTLPEVKNYEPSGTGESPLANIEDWVNTTCPQCGGAAQRETNTMPNWAGSSWYFLAYCDPKNTKNLFTLPGESKHTVDANQYSHDILVEFKEIYEELKNRGVDVWSFGSLAVSGYNKGFVKDIGDIDLIALEKDKELILEYFAQTKYEGKEVKPNVYCFENNNWEIEISFAETKKEDYVVRFQSGDEIVINKEHFTLEERCFLKYFRFRSLAPEYLIDFYRNIVKKSNTKHLIEILEDYLNSKINYWSPVDLYAGGPEHAILHLLFSRFWNQFLYDIGVIDNKEPYRKRVSHDMILSYDGQKMSKSKGNVINPNDIVNKYGADTFRAYIMFIGPYNQSAMWNENGLVGVHKWIKRVYKLTAFLNEETPCKAEEKDINKLIKKITADIENFNFNTAVAAMMEFVNDVYKRKQLSIISFKKFLQVLAPFTPHLVEEMWKDIGEKESVLAASWPTFDEEFCQDEEVTYAITINGKVRNTLSLDVNLQKKEVLALVKADEKIAKILADKEIKKEIFVPGKLVNFVIG